MSERYKITLNPEDYDDWSTYYVKGADGEERKVARVYVNEDQPKGYAKVEKVYDQE